MVFFLAPVAVAGYMYYQKQKEEEEEEEQERQQQQQKEGNGGKFENDVDAKTTPTGPVVVLTKDNAADSEASSNVVDRQLQQQQFEAERTNLPETVHAISATDSPMSARESDVTTQKNNPSLQKKQQQQQQQQRSVNFLSTTDREQLSRMVNNVTESWSKKFQAFCNEWENEIAEAKRTTRGGIAT
jgi:type III secretory pathway component EscV